jgi:hypothetical protein
VLTLQISIITRDKRGKFTANLHILLEEEMTIEEIIKELEKEYFLIPKHNWISFVGGFLGIAILAIFGSYKGAMMAVEGTAAKAALGEIEKAKIESANDRAKIGDYAREIKNGNLTQGIIKSLKLNSDFQSRIKGDRGAKGEKGDSGVVTSTNNGQYLILENSSQKRTVLIGSSSNDRDGIIVLSDKQGNAVVKIHEGGFFILKDNEWVEPYLRKVNSDSKKP